MMIHGAVVSESDRASCVTSSATGPRTAQMIRDHTALQHYEDHSRHNFGVAWQGLHEHTDSQQAGRHHCYRSEVHYLLGSFYSCYGVGSLLPAVRLGRTNAAPIELASCRSAGKLCLSRCTLAFFGNGVTVTPHGPTGWRGLSPRRLLLLP